MQKEISLVFKTYKFYLALYTCTEKMPKKDRFTLGQKCENMTLEILENLYTVNAQKDEMKIPLLWKIDNKLKVMRAVVRITHDVRAFDDKQYILLEKLLIELGKMLGGWIKSLSPENHKTNQK